MLLEKFPFKCHRFPYFSRGTLVPEAVRRAQRWAVMQRSPSRHPQPAQPGRPTKRDVAMAEFSLRALGSAKTQDFALFSAINSARALEIYVA